MAIRETYRKWRRWHLYVNFSCFRIRLRFPTNACPSLPPIPLPHPAPQTNKHNKHDTWFKTTTNWYDIPRGNTTKLDLKLVSNFMGTMWDCCDTLFYDKHYRNLTGPSSTMANTEICRNRIFLVGVRPAAPPSQIPCISLLASWRFREFATSERQPACALWSFFIYV